MANDPAAFYDFRLLTHCRQIPRCALVKRLDTAAGAVGPTAQRMSTKKSFETIFDIFFIDILQACFCRQVKPAAFVWELKGC